MKQETMTAAEYRAMPPSERKAKYGNRKVKTEDGSFDSQREYGHWLMLRDAEKKGEVRNLQRQVRYSLEVNGQKVCVYVADFVYEHCGLGMTTNDEGRIVFRWKEIVADSKGFKTEGFRLKKKLMKACLGVDVCEL